MKVQKFGRSDTSEALEALSAIALSGFFTTDVDGEDRGEIAYS